MKPERSHVVLSLVMLTGALAVGCASHTPMSDPALDAARRQADQMVRQARADAAALRSELAATRIAAAKKEAEILELQRQVAQLRQENAQIRHESVEVKRARAEAQQGAEAKQGEMMVLRAERDHLVQVNSATQAQLAELPKLRQSLTDAVTAQERLATRVLELEASLATLTMEMVEMKQMVAEREKASPKAAAATKKKATPAAISTEPAAGKPADKPKAP